MTDEVFAAEDSFCHVTTSSPDSVESFPSRGSRDLCEHGMPYDGICKPPSEREGDRFSGGGSLRHFKIFALHHSTCLLTRALQLLRVLPHPTVSGAPSQREPWMSANKARGMLAYRYPVGGDLLDAPLYGVLPYVGILGVFAPTERLL